MSDLAHFPKDEIGLILLLQHVDPQIRQQAAYALGRVSNISEVGFRALGESLLDLNDEVCIASAVSLFGYGSSCQVAIPNLVKAMDHRNPYVQRIVLGTLSLIEPDAIVAIPTNMNRLLDSDLTTNK